MKVGVIGCGNIALSHIAALEKMFDVDSILVFDIDVNKVYDIKSKFSKVKVFENIDELIKLSQKIIITTPNNTHFDIINKIANINLVPILCEKPLTTNYEDAIKIEKITLDRLKIGFNLRFNKALEYIKYEILKGEEILFVDQKFVKNSAIKKVDFRWRDDETQRLSSGSFGDLSSHLIDFLEYLTENKVDVENSFLKKGTRINEKNGKKVFSDDNSLFFGLTENKVGFKIYSTKSEKNTEKLGFYLTIETKDKKISYNTKTNQINIEYNNCLKNDIINIPYEEIDKSPDTELKYFSDSFYYQDKAFIKEEYENMADIKQAVHIQEIISKLFL